MVNSSFFLSLKEILLIGKKHTNNIYGFFRDFSLILSWHACCIYSLLHRGEYTQHTIILEIEKTSIYYSHMPPNLALWLTLSGSTYPYLEKISVNPKMFEPLRLDCIVHQYYHYFKTGPGQQHFYMAAITETCLYNFDPLKTQFYIVKLGFTGVCIICLIIARKHRLWVIVRTASPRRF